MENQDLLLSEQRTIFRKATEEDIVDEYRLATAMFGEATHSIPVRQAWLTRNPDTDFILRDRGQLVGFLNVLPVRHEVLQSFLRGEIRGWDIPAEDILPYTPASRVECLIMGMGTTPQAEPQRRAHYGRRLLHGFLRSLHELAEKNVVITMFYATSSTPTGIALLKNAEFEIIGQIGKRLVFAFDPLTSQKPLALRYREALEVQKE